MAKRPSLNNSKPYFQLGDSITICNDDILKTAHIKPKSIDLIVTSPPYNVDVEYGEFNDGRPYREYMKFTQEWLRRVRRFTKKDGRMCLNIPLDKNKGGQQSVYADIVTRAKKAGWKYHATIIWNEQNISRRTAWGSWLSASAPYVIAPVEAIVVMYNSEWKKTNKGLSDITRDEFLLWTNGMWNFNGESAKRLGHPSPFPLELPRRCIKLFSYVGDTVLDPFLGSGSTLVSCYETKRKGIGVEINKQYCKIAVDRLLKRCQAKQKRRKEKGMFWPLVRQRMKERAIQLYVSDHPESGTPPKPKELREGGYLQMAKTLTLREAYQERKIRTVKNQSR